MSDKLTHTRGNLALKLQNENPPGHLEQFTPPVVVSDPQIPQTPCYLQLLKNDYKSLLILALLQIPTIEVT